MKRGAKCRYGVLCSCTADAVRTVNQLPYCERHATLVERIRRNVEKHSDLLERLAEAP